MFRLRTKNTRWFTLFHQPWPPSPAVATKLEPSQLVEEEKTPYYSTEHFYPARLGDILHGRYQIVTKLGHGSSSTVWLARDLQRLRWLNERYVTIKINATHDSAQRDGPESELTMMKRITDTNPQHEGWHFVRKLVDSFTVDGARSKHICLAFEPLREPLWLYRRRFIGEVIPPDVFKVMLQMILEGLDYLHSDCQVIHTDLKPDNIMVKMEDLAILERDANDEYQHPLPQKHTEDGRIIYLSRNNYGQLTSPTGTIQITDFGLSVMGNVPHDGCIQNEAYRAPEVILDAGYTYSADIWSLGVMLWDLLEARGLFKALNRDGSDEYDDQVHLAYITALLGPAPKDSVRGRRSSMFYGPDGLLREPVLIPEGFTFENTVASMEGEKKKLFINFVRRMIAWRPEARSSARELLNDPWLHADST